MKKITTLLFATIIFLATAANAQNTESCTHCNMFIKDLNHNATLTQNGKILNFDAIECLVNYIKEKALTDDAKMTIADYEIGLQVNAESAYYLKSKGIPSPMGANLSGFETEETAREYKKKKGGDIYNWEELKARFDDSKFGAVPHHQHNHFRPDAHAPIGVTGDHLHPHGGLMVTYKAMFMNMDGNLTGSDAIEDEEISKMYMNSPQEMNMVMHMLGVMYAPSNKVTLMLMQNYVSNSMDMIHRMTMADGMKMEEDFTMKSSGLGDLKASVLLALYNSASNSVHLNVGMSVPVGSVNEKGDMPMKDDSKFPYTMQLGSGTVDFNLGATYKKSFTSGSIGAQVMGTHRTGNNSEGYQLGDFAQLNLWGAVNLGKTVSVSARILGVMAEAISGADRDLMPMMAPAANTDNYGHKRVNGFVGLNYAFSNDSKFNKLRLGIEAGLPIYQYLEGIQMNENYTINCGVKYAIL
jgi:nitrous oxide reductase accessory protein NosL